MTNSNFIKKVSFLTSSKVFLYITYAFSFSISLTPFVSSLMLSSFLVLSIFHIKMKRNNSFEYKAVIFLFILFILYLLSLMFTPYFERGIKLAYKIFPIIIIPNIIYLTNLNQKLNYVSFKIFFVLGIITSCIISLFSGLYNLIIYEDIQYLFYYRLCGFLHLHPTYYSLYVITALHLVRGIQNNLVNKYKICIIILFLIFIFLLQSKIALIALVLYFGIIFFKLKSKSLIFKNHIMLLMMVVFVFIISLRLDYNRFADFFKPRTSIEIGNESEDGIYQRLWLWNEAKDQIKEKPWFGYGVGSQNKIFNWKIQKKILSSQNSYTYSRASKNISKLNLHNQYLQIFYELGIIGGILFLLSIIFVILKALKTNKTDFLFVYSFFLIFMLTENLFERQMGIYFYAFILSLLYFEKVVPVCNKK